MVIIADKRVQIDLQPHIRKIHNTMLTRKSQFDVSLTLYQSYADKDVPNRSCVIKLLKQRGFLNLFI